MARNEKTSDDIAALAGKVLGGKKATQTDARRLAGSALTQVPDRKGSSGRRSRGGGNRGR